MSQVVLIPIDQKPMVIIINQEEVEIVWENVSRRYFSQEVASALFTLQYIQFNRKPFLSFCAIHLL